MSDASVESKIDRSPPMTRVVPSNGDIMAADGPKKDLPTGSNPNRGGTPSRVPSRKVCQLWTEDLEVVRFAIADYKYSAIIGANSKEITSVKCLIDTDTSPNLVNKSFSRQKWTDRIKQQRMLKIRSANRQPIKSERVIMLHLRLGDHYTRLQFGVVSGLAFDVVLGNSFIDRYIKIPSLPSVSSYHGISIR